MTQSTPKVDPAKRMVATLVDFVVAGLLTFFFHWLLTWISAPLVGIAYLLCRDVAIQNGYGLSLGKRLLKLQVSQTKGMPCDILSSLKRNVPLALGPIAALLLSLPLSLFPWIGELLQALVALAITGIIIGTETYKLFDDPKGIRLGDLFAGTYVHEEVAQ